MPRVAAMLASPLILWWDFHLKWGDSSLSFSVSLITSQHLLIGCQFFGGFLTLLSPFFSLSTCTSISLSFIVPMMVVQGNNKTLLVATYFNLLALSDVTWHSVHHNREETDPLKSDLQTLQSVIFISKNHWF